MLAGASEYMHEIYITFFYNELVYLPLVQKSGRGVVWWTMESTFQMGKHECISWRSKTFLAVNFESTMIMMIENKNKKSLHPSIV